MQKIYLIANWKMNLSLKESAFLAQEIVKVNQKIAGTNIELILCPAYPALCEVSKSIKGTDIKLGAQDVFYEDEGSFAGEVSGPMLAELGCQYVIIGHSSRRQELKESDEVINQKVKAALRNKLIPIICVGENQEEKQQGRSDLVAMQQVDRALQGVNVGPQDKVIISYEPIWAVGTGQTDFPGDTQHVAQVVKQLILDIYSLEVQQNNFCIIYGGSITAETVNSFVSPGLIDGVLVGTASRQSETFIPIIDKLVKK